MKTVRRYIYQETIISVTFSSFIFLALFFFFDYVDELRLVARLNVANQQVFQSFLYVALQLPRHLYELLPITVLIGTIFVMAKMARNSEFTIFRTSGLGPWLALKTLLALGLFFVLVTFAVGDYVAPLAEQASKVIRSSQKIGFSSGQSSTWLREEQSKSSFIVNVGYLGRDSVMNDIRIFEFDKGWNLVSQISAKYGRFDSNGFWKLSDAKKSSYSELIGKSTKKESFKNEAEFPEIKWVTQITVGMVAASLQNPSEMGTYDLFQHVRHLDGSGQTAQRYEIEFWRKVFYPLSCLVMVVLALPFAYLHFRSGSISAHVFIGVMTGISFFLLNNVLGFAGNLQNWQPWLTAAAPSIFYSILSLCAFSWLVLRQ